MPRRTIKDYENMISRIEKIDTQVDQLITLMREGLKIGIRNHAIAMVIII